MNDLYDEKNTWNEKNENEGGDSTKWVILLNSGGKLKKPFSGVAIGRKEFALEIAKELLVQFRQAWPGKMAEVYVKREDDNCSKK